MKLTFPWEDDRGKLLKPEIIKISSSRYSDSEMKTMLKKLMSSGAPKHTNTATAFMLAGLRGVNFSYNDIIIE